MKRLALQANYKIICFFCFSWGWEKDVFIFLFTFQMQVLYLCVDDIR